MSLNSLLIVLSSNLPNMVNIYSLVYFVIKSFQNRLFDIDSELFSEFTLKLIINNEKKDYLKQLFERTNTNISYNVPRKIIKSKSINEKCIETGCWLFIYSIEELIKMI